MPYGLRHNENRIYKMDRWYGHNFPLKYFGTSHQTLILMKTSSKRLDQDEHIHHIQDVLLKTKIFVLAIRLEDVFKTFSRCLQDVLQKRLQDVFKTSSKHLQDVLPRRLQEVFKAF